MSDQLKTRIISPYLPIILAPIILFSPLIFTGKALIWGTPSTQFIPWWDFAFNSLLQGDLPLWNPLVGMGAPLAANYQSALFYPLYWPLFLVYSFGGVGWMAWAVSLVVCFHLIWSGIGLANLLAELKVSKLGQAVGGLAFSLSGYLVARAGFLSINAAAAWLPWLLLFVYRLANGKEHSFPLLSGSMTMLMLAGHAQTAWYVLILSGLWLFFWSLTLRGNETRLRSSVNALLKFAGAGILAVTISAVQLLPTFEYLLNSQRAAEYGYAEAMTYSFWPWRFLTYLVPDLFGSPAAGNYWGYGNYWEDAVYFGLLPLMMAVSVVIKTLRINRDNEDSEKRFKQGNLVIFLLAIIGISFLMALGDNTFIFPFLYRNIPTFNLFQAPSRWTIWAAVSLAILSGLGIDQLTPPAGKRLYFTRLGAAGAFAISIGSFLAWVFLDDIKITFLTATAKTGLIAFLAVVLILFVPVRNMKNSSILWGSLAVVLVIVDLVAAGWGLNPGVKKSFYTIEKDHQMTGRLWLPTDLEYDLKYSRFFLFDSFQPEWEWNRMHEVYLPNLNMLQRVEMVNNFDPLLPNTYKNWMERIDQAGLEQRMLSLMDVSGIITLTDDQISIEKIQLPENKRVRVAGCAAILENQSQAFARLESGIGPEDQSDLSVQSAQEFSCEQGVTGSARVLDHKNGYLKVQVNLSGDGLVFWSQTWYPGWKVRIDGGGGRDVLPAEYNFQAAPVPAGSHEVEFIYRPASFIWGGCITILGLGVWGGSAVWMKKKQERKQGHD